MPLIQSLEYNTGIISAIADVGAIRRLSQHLPHTCRSLLKGIELSSTYALAAQHLSNSQQGLESLVRLKPLCQAVICSLFLRVESKLNLRRV